jgi:hypothetical protein
MNLNEWPNCPIPDCANKVCVWAGTGLCYKCSEKILGVLSMAQRYLQTHDKDGKLLPGKTNGR